MLCEMKSVSARIWTRVAVSNSCDDNHYTTRIIRFISFPRVSVLCEMQSVPSRVWTRVAVSISYDDNHYTTGTSCRDAVGIFYIIITVTISLWKQLAICIFPVSSMYGTKALKSPNNSITTRLFWNVWFDEHSELVRMLIDFSENRFNFT